MRTKFWGVCGSVPAPLTAERVYQKVLRALGETLKHPLQPDMAALARDGLTKEALDAIVAPWMQKHLPFELMGTHGGNR